MNVLSISGNPELATVHVGQLDDGNSVEFVESVQPPRTVREKWVNIISTMVGCPVGCKMCDAGGGYLRSLTAGEMQDQLDILAHIKFPDGKINTQMWKLQLARMGEPTLNPQVLVFLRNLATQNHENLVISLSTVGPSQCAPFIQELRKIKDAGFRGRFQLQFSIHSTDDEARRRLIPVKGLALPEIAVLGRQFRSPGDKKITLNFIVMKDVPIETQRIARLFDPENFLIKLTPLNPTYRAQYHKILPGFDPENPVAVNELVREFETLGFETILSIGELEENQIGSNCGQYVARLQ
ncbi:MAG: radical SAM protein [Candidatus Thermoplasmatota archaeon]|nr:radical SAM protein [Euryarchaeota archaeon]MBU4031963.1 radical SAM protein [Candidatus Thermoplasmatota archaeon]MBU4071579.1 radical SAM protein [Candidatus Thermoplasmatota archaeon]MBU4143607.1 radical SAM protein [Candidatus Thermoplasmatota archaeon]MBU4591340.1 radical SAM protein [Candidatus Thermoplasmatota archaeon]